MVPLQVKIINFVQIKPNNHEKADGIDRFGHQCGEWPKNLP